MTPRPPTGSIPARNAARLARVISDELRDAETIHQGIARRHPGSTLPAAIAEALEAWSCGRPLAEVRDMLTGDAP